MSNIPRIDAMLKDMRQQREQAERDRETALKTLYMQAGGGWVCTKTIADRHVMIRVNKITGIIHDPETGQTEIWTGDTCYKLQELYSKVVWAAKKALTIAPNETIEL